MCRAEFLQHSPWKFHSRTWLHTYRLKYHHSPHCVVLWLYTVVEASSNIGNEKSQLRNYMDKVVFYLYSPGILLYIVLIVHVLKRHSSFLASSFFTSNKYTPVTVAVRFFGKTTNNLKIVVVPSGLITSQDVKCHFTSSRL